MKKINAFTSILCLFIPILLSSGCSENQEKKAEAAFSSNEAARNIKYGGILRLNSATAMMSLYPPSYTPHQPYPVAAQLFEGLFHTDDNGNIIPQLAKNYRYNPDFFQYTIDLRDNIYFHDHPIFPQGKGRRVTAKDVAYALKRLCMNHPENKNARHFIYTIKGALRLYNQNPKTINADLLPTGLEVVNDHQLRITLNQHDPFFLNKLAMPAAYIYPPEILEKYGTDNRLEAVGTGPFKVKSISPDISMVLEKNEKYYQKDSSGNVLPYLNALSYQFIKDKKTEILEFNKGHIDIISALNGDESVRILMQQTTNSKGEIRDLELCQVFKNEITLLAINPKINHLNSPNFRKALNYALDKDALLQFAANNEAMNTNYFELNPSLKQKEIRKNPYSIDSAYYYLSLSAYQTGKEAPLIITYLKDNPTQAKIARDLVNQWLKMGVIVNTSGLEAREWEQAMRTNSYQIAIRSLKGDMPQDYLYPFYSGKMPALVKEFRPVYYNRQFDAYFRQAIEAQKEERAYKYLRKAEKILQQDMPCITLWYEGDYTLYQSFIKEYKCTSNQAFPLTKVYFQKAIDI